MEGHIPARRTTWPGLARLWSETTGSPEIVVAVLDGPVDRSHPCFRGARLRQVETLVAATEQQGRSSQHGTHVASVIFGRHGGPVDGVAPGCSGLLVPIFAEQADGAPIPCSQIDLARGITQAVEQGAHIINISGGEPTASNEAHPLLATALRLCAENQVLVVAAAGNEGCECLHIPAAVPTVLTVGAMDRRGLPMEQSNWGAAYRAKGVLAPGENIVGAVPGGGVAAHSGTSFATPIVSGVAALLLSLQLERGEKPDSGAVREAILRSAHPCDGKEFDDCRTFLVGSLNIAGAHAFVAEGLPRHAPAQSGGIAMLKAGDVAPEFAAKDHSGREVRLSDFRGETVVLWFYPEASTPGCTTEGCGFRDRFRQYVESGIQILGISTDSVEKNAAFAAEHRLPYRLLSDSDRSVCLAYGACSNANERARRVTYVIGPDGTIVQVYQDIDVATHAEAVVSALSGRTSTVNSPSAVSPEGQPQTSDCGCVYANRGNAMEKRLQNDERLQHNEESAVGMRPSFEQNEQVHGLPAPQSIGIDTLPMGTLPLWGTIAAIMPSQANSAEKREGPALVYALGTIGYDFGNQSQQDSLTRSMPNGANPNDPLQLLAMLEASPHEATALIWTLEQEGTPIYALQPGGPYATVAYERLREFLGDQVREGVDRVSLPGYLVGRAQLSTGQVVPVVVPEPRGMFSWRTPNLVNAVLGEAPKKADEKAAFDKRAMDVHNFLERVYYELRNLGVTPQERAVNFAATNAFQVSQVFESAAREELALRGIEVVRSPISRPGSDTWDVQLTFFSPRDRLGRANQVFRISVDVRSVVPITVGPVRSWASY